MSDHQPATREGAAPQPNGFPAALARFAPPGAESDAVIAALLGSNDRAEVDALRAGDLDMPLDKVPALAFAFGQDPAELVSLWLEQHRAPVHDEAAAAAPAMAPTGSAPAPRSVGSIDPQRQSVLSHRFREGSLMAIARMAKERGLTQRQVLVQVLVAFGVPIMPEDQGKRPPLRRRQDEV